VTSPTPSRRAAAFTTKTGIMLGLGETREEIEPDRRGQAARPTEDRAVSQPLQAPARRGKSMIDLESRFP